MWLIFSYGKSPGSLWKPVSSAIWWQHTSLAGVRSTACQGFCRDRNQQEIRGLGKVETASYDAKL